MRGGSGIFTGGNLGVPITTLGFCNETLAPPADTVTFGPVTFKDGGTNNFSVRFFNLSLSAPEIIGMLLIKSLVNLFAPSVSTMVRHQLPNSLMYEGGEKRSHVNVVECNESFCTLGLKHSSVSSSGGE